VSESNEQPNPAVSRRRLLRNSAVVAGAAAATAMVAAPAANAADGGPVLIGTANAATNTTTVTIDGAAGGADPTLALNNAAGPSLFLQPLAGDYTGDGLKLGQLANTEIGPLLGVVTQTGFETTYLATGIDLASLPTPYALPNPTRLVDLRPKSGIDGVLRSSPEAFDSQHRLKAGAWIDIEIPINSSEFQIPSAFVNVTAVSPTATGWMAAYPPGPFPGTSTVNMTLNQTTSNSAFVATGEVLGKYAIRVITNQPAWVVVDLTGVTLMGGGQQAVQAQRLTGRAARTARLRSTLAAKLVDKLRAARPTR